jgi:hypothetical protein
MHGRFPFHLSMRPRITLTASPITSYCHAKRRSSYLSTLLDQARA